MTLASGEDAQADGTHSPIAAIAVLQRNGSSNSTSGDGTSRLSTTTTTSEDSSGCQSTAQSRQPYPDVYDPVECRLTQTEDNFELPAIFERQESEVGSETETKPRTDPAPNGSEAQSKQHSNPRPLEASTPVDEGRLWRRAIYLPHIHVNVVNLARALQYPLVIASIEAHSSAGATPGHLPDSWLLLSSLDAISTSLDYLPLPSPRAGAVAFGSTARSIDTSGSGLLAAAVRSGAVATHRSPELCSASTTLSCGDFNVGTSLKFSRPVSGAVPPLHASILRNRTRNC